jgi:transcriptional repressor NrdR
VICPFCNADNDRVIDSRAAENGVAVRRRRGCAVCGRRFTTYERVEKTARLMVIKKDGSRVPFEPQNVLRGIQSACGKRPIPEEAKLRLVQEVEDALYRDFDREVPSEEIGKLVATRLRDLDQIAYIRFASEQYSFRSLDDIADEVQELRNRPRDLPNQTDLFSKPT